MENYRAARKTVSTADILGPLYLVTGFWRARWRSRGSDMMTLGAILGFGALGAEAFNRRSRATQTGENHMTKRKTAPATERVGASAFDIDGLLAMNQRIYQNMMRVHTEFLDFTSRRLRADIEVAQRLTGGGKPGDAVAAVYGFQRQIVSDYADEASELVKMSTSMAGYLIQEVEDDVKEVVEEVEDDVKEVVEEVEDDVKEVVEEVEDDVKEVVGEVEDDVKEVAGARERVG